MMISLAAVVIMSIAAYITYGYQKRELVITRTAPVADEKKPTKTQHKNIAISTPDLSRVPDDDRIVDILNNELPQVCDMCDGDVLDCLTEYEINKVFVQNDGYQDQMTIEVVTGKKTYAVVINLDDYAVLDSGGKVDKDACATHTVISPDMYIDSGDDPPKSHHVSVPEKQ